MKLRPSHIIALGASAIGALAATPANAAMYLACNGTPIVWEWGHFETVRNVCSIPPGSTSSDAYLGSIGESNQIVNVVTNIGDDPPDKCEYTFDDAWNQVAHVDPAKIDGKLGRTHIIYDGCNFSWSTEHIVEIDILINNTIPTDNAPETPMPFNHGRPTFLHEFGHAHGLEHSEVLDVMRAASPSPLTGGTGEHAVWFPDDALGLRFLYPGKAVFQADVFATPQMLTGAGVMDANPPAAFCRSSGGPLSVTYTVGNPGTENEWTMSSFFLANIDIPAGYTDPAASLLGWSWDFVAAQSWTTNNTSFTVPPGLEPGAYRVYHHVDVNGPVDANPNNNVAGTSIVVQIMDC